MMTTRVPAVLIIDDNAENLEFLSEMLTAQGYRVHTASNGKSAIQAAVADTPDLILLDVRMPGMDGYEACQRLKSIASLAKTPVVFLSGLHDVEDKLKAFSAGGVDYVTKPFDVHEIRARLETHLKIRQLQSELERHNHNLQELVREQIRDITDAHAATIVALANLAESRDDQTGNHIVRVQSFCEMLAARLRAYPAFKSVIDNDFVESLRRAAPLHDIGKVGIPDSILLKPDRLNQEEMEVMKSHTEIGARTLERVLQVYPHNKFIRMGVEIARSHHERWDGTGYPDGLQGEKIPLSARVLAVADQYDALRGLRPYKPALDHGRTVEIMSKGDGRTMPSHFDPRILKTFLEAEDEFLAVFNRLVEPLEGVSSADQPLHPLLNTSDLSVAHPSSDCDGAKTF